jgi:predicted DNA-binding protein (UPF0251 family)
MEIPSGATRRQLKAAKLVFIDGLTHADAARRMRIARPSLTELISRFKARIRANGHIVPREASKAPSIVTFTTLGVSDFPAAA